MCRRLGWWEQGAGAVRFVPLGTRGAALEGTGAARSPREGGPSRQQGAEVQGVGGA